MFQSVVLHIAEVSGGLLLLYLGGQFLVKGASALARKFEVPVIVVGLTVVAFGTSAPELFVSLVSAWRGLMPVSVGNVVGSNVINIALVLGFAAVLKPIRVSGKIAFIDTPLMIASYGVLFLVIANLDGSTSVWQNGTIATWEGMLMLALLATYLYGLYRSARKGGVEAIEEIDLAEIPQEAHQSVLMLLLKVAAGAAGLAFGAEFLVGGASWIAREVFDVSERFIGITVVALGTSLPELVTSVVAVARGEMDISLGNIVGSNLFNSLMVLGLTSIVRNIEVGANDFRWDFAIMSGISILLFVIIALRRELPRWGGMLLLLSYGGYFVFLINTRTI